MIAEAPVNNEEMMVKARKFVERLRSARIFRRLHVDADFNRDNFLTISVTINDGLCTCKTKPFTVHVPSIEFPTLYELIEDAIAESVRRIVREKTAPELVVPGTSPVEFANEPTDGDEVWQL